MATAGIDRHRHGNGGNDYGQGRARCLRTNVITNIHFGMWQNRKVHHDTQSDKARLAVCTGADTSTPNTAQFNPTKEHAAMGGNKGFGEVASLNVRLEGAAKNWPAYVR